MSKKKKKTNSTKPIKKKMFFLDVPIYDREICVIVGMTHAEAIASAKRQGCTNRFIEELSRDTVRDSGFWEGGAAGMAIDTGNSAAILLIPPFKDSWEWYDILNHECFHLTQFIGQKLNMWDDLESVAYLHDWIFKNIRRRCSGQIKC